MREALWCELKCQKKRALLNTVPRNAFPFGDASLQALLALSALYTLTERAATTLDSGCHAALGELHSTFTKPRRRQTPSVCHDARQAAEEMLHFVA